MNKMLLYTHSRSKHTRKPAQIVYFCLMLIAGYSLQAIKPTNLFEPYDILLFKPIPENRCVDISCTYEGTFHMRSFQADPEDRANNPAKTFSNTFRHQAEPLQLWQDSQNYFAAIKGSKITSQENSIAQQYNIEAGGLNPLFKVKADVRIPVNLMFAARYAITPTVSIGLYLPFYTMEVAHIRWNRITNSKAKTFQGNISSSIETLEKIGKINLRDGWKKQGIGDLSALVWWRDTYCQNKEWLKKVTAGIRGGLTFPTGTTGDNDRLFSLPFGNDAGLGIVFGGTLELGYWQHIKLGIDAEFLGLFGSTRERRVQTDPQQTDLLFLNKVMAYRDPGFLQHYTIYLTLNEFSNGLSTTLAYQHTRQHENSFIFDNTVFPAHIANDAESSQDWTTHNIVWFINYDAASACNCWYLPKLSVFMKYGFNGKRALVPDSAGAQLSLSF